MDTAFQTGYTSNSGELKEESNERSCIFFEKNVTFVQLLPTRQVSLSVSHEKHTEQQA